MELNMVRLVVRVDRLEDMLPLYEALNGLAISLNADLGGLNQKARSKMGSGIVEVSYASYGTIYGSIKGEVVILTPRPMSETVPPVRITGIENLCSEYRLEDTGGLNIIKEGETPIRYHISR